MTKKQLQNQIDNLQGEIRVINSVLWESVTLNNVLRPRSIVDEIPKLAKKFEALEKYLGIEYKVEDTHTEGYVKKADYIFGKDIAVGIGQIKPKCCGGNMVSSCPIHSKKIKK